jgi:tetratricopeptide (TPR) repeat protein
VRIRAPEDAGWKMTLEHRPAVPASITYEQFVEAVVAGRASEAIRRLRSEAAVEPNHVMLSQESLQRLSLMLLFTWGRPREAIPVIELLIERYPAAGGQRLLAEARAASGDVAGAIDLYNKILEQNPNNANVRARLEELRKQ